MTVPAGWKPDPDKVAAHVAREEQRIEAALEAAQEAQDAADEAWRHHDQLVVDLANLRRVVAKYEDPQSGLPPAGEGAQ